MTFSVVIPTYRRPNMLQRLLESIAKQSYLPLEVIVVDDCSPEQDQYLKIISLFNDRIPSLRYLSMSKNSGAPACRNRGILETSGEWVALVDDDDEWCEWKLLEQKMQIEHSSLSNLGLIYTWTDTVWPNGDREAHFRKSIDGLFLSSIIRECFVASPSVLIKRQALIDAGLFDPKMPSCQDWDMWVRIAKCGYQCSCVPKVCTLYHKHDGESIGLSSRATKGYIRFYRKHFFTLLRFRQWRQLGRGFIFWVRLCRL